MKTTSVLMLVCESGRRWLDTARRFVGPFQPVSGKSPGITAQHCEISAQHCEISAQHCELGRVRARLSGEPSVAVLWEVTEAIAPHVALAIAQIGVGRPDVLQLVAMDTSVEMMAPSMTLRLMELSAAGVVHTPEQFPLLARLIRRRFQVSD